MTNPVKKKWASAMGLALMITAVGGVALADDPLPWYEGGDCNPADSNKSATVPLRLYDVNGAVITTGSTTTPIAAFVAADDVVRTGDTFATLFVHLPQTGTAQGAWPGVQATGTSRFDGAGEIAEPGALANKPRVDATVPGSYSLADVAASLPQVATAEGYAGVYELRLRTSSATGGVSDGYAATYLKIGAGSTWTVVDAPPFPDIVDTTTTPTWPAALTYGTASSVGVTVTPASGNDKPTGVVRLVSGASTLSTATLSANGTATLPIGKTRLSPGTKVLQVVYDGAGCTYTGSGSATTAIAVAKAAPSKPTLVVTKKPTTKKTGSAAITVATPGGLAKAGGPAQLRITKGGTTKLVSATVKSGSATAKLPKLPAGKWTVVVTYNGDAYYLSATSKSYALTVKKPKK